jgi:hypothetical protein
MPDLADGDFFGWAVALDGDRLAVGAQGDDTGGTDRGAVHLFTGVGSDFAGLTYASELASGSGAAGMPALADDDYFGTAVALDGGRLAVGAYLDDTGGLDRGAVHLFTGVGADFAGLTWAKKLASGTGASGMPALAYGDGFGVSVALDGDRLAVGATGDNTGGISRGAVHLFTGVGSDFAGLFWEKKLASGTGAAGMPDLANSDWFGLSVALDGDRLAVGATGDDTGGTQRGAVYVFTGVGGDFSGLTWEKKLASGTGAAGMPDLADSDFLGTSVALDGELLAVGSTGDDTGGISPGAVHLFSGVGADFSGLTWEKKLASGTGAADMPALADDDYFGTSVALDGELLAVGAQGDDTGGTDRGAVHLFTGVGSDFSGLNWANKLASGSGAAGMPDLADVDQFGRSVALDGERLAAGAHRDDTGGPLRGAVYLFTGLSTLGSGVIGVDDATFAANPGATSYITPATIAGLLADGVAVTLQANNDIQVLSNVLVGGDGGGSLTLQAGRNIDFLASVQTPYGDLTAVAGDPGANPAYRDPGTPTLTVASGVTLDVLSRTATLAAVGGTVVNNAGDTAIATAEGGRWLVYAADPATTTEGFTSYVKHYDQPFTAGSTPAYAASGNWFLYSLAPTLAVAPVSETIAYGDAAPAFTPSYSGFIDGDTAASAGLSGTATWLIGGATSSSRNWTAGAHEVSYAAGLASDLGYRLADDAASTAELMVTPRDLTAVYLGLDKVYDATTAVTLIELADGVLGGDFIAFSETAAFADKNVGTDKPIDVTGISLVGTDAGNYALTSTTAATSADITPRPVTVSLVGSVSRVYDATTTVALGPENVRVDGLLAGDEVAFATVAEGNFDTPDVGTGKPVTLSSFDVGGADAGNYRLSALPVTGTIGTITPATLTYLADPASAVVGEPVAGLTGSVIGLLGADTLASATRGMLAWSTPATERSPAGSYPIEGSGLSATNYVFVQAPGNATALILVGGAPPEAPLEQTVHPAVEAVDTAAELVVEQPLEPGVVAGAGALVDETQGPATPGAASFAPLNLAVLSREEMQQVLEARDAFKKQLFAEAIFELEEDPSLAEVPPCATLAAADAGLCRMTDAQRQEAGRAMAGQGEAGAYRVKLARLPQIGRKVAVLFGVDAYVDARIPSLDNAVYDAEEVARLLGERLGYEVRVVRNARKADIVRTLNRLSTEVGPGDSVVVYYAGHGDVLEKNGEGYWLPADAAPDDPRQWVSNADISRMLSDIPARQLAMISDSCYSGAFTREGRLAVMEGQVRPAEVLGRRSVVVMSSGGDEPVADSGRGGHSIFAWYLMQDLGRIEDWQPGLSVFRGVQREVSSIFPQTPQYGAAASAGHQAGGDYLFEYRQLEMGG